MMMPGQGAHARRKNCGEKDIVMATLERSHAAPAHGTLSEFLNFLELRGQTWCFAEIGETGGFSVPPSDEVVFYAMIKGTARIAGIGNEIIELQPGHVAMILSGEAHALRNRPDSPAHILGFLREDQNIDIPPTISITGGPVKTRILCGRLKVNLPGGLRRMSLPPYVRLGDMGTTSATLRCETLQLQAAGTGAAALLTRTASLMLAIALRTHPQCPLLFRLSATSDPVARALQLIGADPAAEWSVATLAKRVGMGRSNFAACFTAKVGRTPMEVLTDRRMQYAASLLQQGELKIADVCVRVGYRSEAAFSRRFTRFFGMAPGQMRRSHPRNPSFDLNATWQVSGHPEYCMHY
jgi:AraC-like DNA-binding protein/mannose-6-phosphate isomerase-like protein (cupin superfamily)